MSENEKNRRQFYRKSREKWIFTQSVIIAVVAVAIIISALVSVQLNSKYYIKYSERGSIDYNVFLKENEFFEEDYLGKNQSYVASLIDKIVTNFNYEIDMDADDVNYKYSYTVKARLEIIDNSSGVAIFNPVYELVSVQNKTQSSSNRLTVNEIVVLNYDEYNSLANRFISAYELKNVTSNIVLTLNVDVLSDCNAFTGSSADTYYSELRIPLTTKTVNIKMTSAVPSAEAKMIACTRGAGSEVFETTAIVLCVVEALLIIALLAFVYLTRTDDITYTAKVKKILSQYKSYIQKINNPFDMERYQIIMVDTFDEMLEIRDTIQAPILMHENVDKTCAKFIIPTDSKLLYLYEINIELCDKQEEPKQEPKREPKKENKKALQKQPCAKTAEAPQAVKITIENTEEGEETFEPISEEYIEEFADESIEGVDAINVVWPESREDGKKYRYDPDGNNVEEGDIVLVPTRDVHSDKDVIREAEVVKGNYKVDPSSLEHPLKKIIGVVKRRAEKVFTAMITPDDAEK